jgi:hypothetical protein
MTDLSALPPRERARRYRALAREAREKAALCTGELQSSFIRVAEKWEQQALEADAEAKDEPRT